MSRSQGGDASSPEAIRPHSRRHTAPSYRIERITDVESASFRSQPRSADVQLLAQAGAAGSALRLRLRTAGVDPKLARLLLLFDGRRALRVSDVAWRLNVSTATASRHLDRAERAGLVDKMYLPQDRRGTWARSTRRGRELRATVLEHLTRSAPYERPWGPGYGIRATPRHLVEE